MDDLVSFIIPVYNGENCIEKCVNSIIEQDYPNLEIIIVDDGSIDLTYSVCKKLSINDSRIQVYSVPNAGVSNARNYGLSRALGRWIMFIDADDTIASGSLSNAVTLAYQYGADTVCLNGKYVCDDKISNMNVFVSVDGQNSFVVEDEETLIRHLYSNSTTPYFGDYYRAVWGKLLSARIIKDKVLRFPVGIKIGEDALFLIDYFSESRKVVFSNITAYYYRVDSTSVTGKYKEDFFNYQVAEFCAMVDKFKQHNLNYVEEGIYFWHKAEKELINNELKHTLDIKEIVVKLTPFMRNSILAKYMKMFDNGGIKSHIRTIMFKCGLYRLALLIDIILLKNCKD